MKCLSIAAKTIAAAVFAIALTSPHAAFAGAPSPAPSLSLEPVARTPRLGTPLHVRLFAGNLAIRDVTVSQKSEAWHSVTQPVVARDASGASSIDIVPQRLGQVDVQVTAQLANGQIAERRMTLEVALPEQPPVAFHASDKDVLFIEKGAIKPLMPTARFAGMTEDIAIDPSLVTYKVAHDDLDDNPPLEVSADGHVTAHSRGTMTIAATFMGKTSLCKVKVLPHLD